MFLPVEFFLGNPQFLCKFERVKLWEIAPDSPKFSPATVLRYTVLKYNTHKQTDKQTDEHTIPF